MLRRASLVLFLASLAAALSLVRDASAFDLICADSIDVVVTPSVTGFTDGNDIALIVNRGAADIGLAELSGATFTLVSSNPSVSDAVSILNASHATPIHPFEAVGTMLAGSPLLTRVLPGETARNLFPTGLFWLGASFPAGYTGTAVCNITMTLGGDVAEYSTFVNIRQGPEFQIAVVHAGRVSSHPSATAAHPSTWGAIKRLYH